MKPTLQMKSISTALLTFYDNPQQLFMTLGPP